MIVSGGDWMHARSSPLPPPLPRLLRILGSERDVTQEHEATMRIREEHEGRLRAQAAMAAGEKAMAYACHGTCCPL